MFLTSHNPPFPGSATSNIHHSMGKFLSFPISFAQCFLFHGLTISLLQSPDIVVQVLMTNKPFHLGLVTCLNCLRSGCSRILSKRAWTVLTGFSLINRSLWISAFPFACTLIILLIFHVQECKRELIGLCCLGARTRSQSHPYSTWIRLKHFGESWSIWIYFNGSLTACGAISQLLKYFLKAFFS